MKKSVDNIYLNLSYNPVEAAGQNISQALISQTLTSPILNDPSEYYASIIRFRIPTEMIAMYRFPIDINQSNPNLSGLRIGVTNSVSKFTQRLTYAPASMGLSAPITTALLPPFFNSDQLNLPYYKCYSIDVLIRAFNVAIAQAITTSAYGVAAPYFIYDAKSELISCIVDNAFSAGGFSLYINNLSLNYLSSFPFIKNTQPTDFDEEYFKFDVLPYLGVSPYRFEQEYNAMSLWFDLQKIIITSNSMPIRSENVPLENTGVSNSMPIFTDFEIALDSVSLSNATAIYNSQSQYRLCDLISNQPMSKIDLGFYYQDRYGTIQPIFINASQSISVKIGFFKKALYKNLEY
jgi:hypothetical protein